MGQFPPSRLVVAVALPDRSTQLHETEEPLVTRPRQDATLATNGKFWAAFVPRAKRVCWDMETLRIDAPFILRSRSRAPITVFT